MSVSLYLVALLVLAGCDAGTVSPNLYAAQSNAEATQQVVRVSLQATADARQFFYDQQAKAAFNATMQAAQTQSAAEAEIALIEARATAQQGDQNLIATGTASAIQAVATQQAYDLQATVQNAEVQATLQAFDDAHASRELSLQIKGLTAQLWAVTRWVLVSLLALAVIYGVWRWVESKRAGWSAIHHDTNGKAPIVFLGGRLVNMDRAFYPVIDAANPMTPDDRYQAQVVDADQKTDLARAVSTGGSPGRTPIGPISQPTVRFLDRGEAPPLDLLPDPDVSNILDAEWRTE